MVVDTRLKEEKTTPKRYITIEKLQNLYTKKDENKYSKWALRTTRNWTNAQLVAIKAAISILLANVVWSEVRSEDLDQSFHWPRYLLMTSLVIILYITFKFENMNNTIEDIREEQKLKIDNSRVAQILTLDYLFNQLLPNTNDFDKQVNMLKIVPMMMSYIDADQVKKEVSTGFQLVADVTTTVIDKIDGIRKDIRDNINIDRLLANITEIPRPLKQQKESLDPLTPSDSRFPST